MRSRLGRKRVQIEDLKQLHVGYARAQMSRGGVPLPPIKPKGAIGVASATKAPLVATAPEQDAQPSGGEITAPTITVDEPPNISVAEPAVARAEELAAINVDPAVVPAARPAPDMAAIDKTAPVDGAACAGIEPSEPEAFVQPAAATIEPATPKQRFRLAPLVVAAGLSAGITLLATHEFSHQSHEPAQAVSIAATRPGLPAKNDHAGPVLSVAAAPNAASSTIARGDLARPAVPASASSQPSAVAIAPPHPALSGPHADAPPRPLTEKDLLPDSPKGDLAGPPGGLAHVDPREFGGHERKLLETDTRVATVQLDEGSTEAAPASVFEAPVRTVLRALHRKPSPVAATKPAAQSTTTVASEKAPATSLAASAKTTPATAKAAAAAETQPVKSPNADGDQKLF
jgi:hypothetical protein